MEGKSAFISKDGKGKVKLEYHESGEDRIRLWETRKGNTLETTFAIDGAVLLQLPLRVSEKELEYRIKQTLSDAKISDVAYKDYTEIKIAKECPKCKESKLQRYVDAFASTGEIPIVPIYYCTSCNTKSFYLTDKYLEHLVASNTELFEEKEKDELNANKDAALNELREYIIRMFASKKILNIK